MTFLPIVIHPCFQECQNFTLDQFWRDVFFNCACNKFPKGVRYDSTKNTIFVRTSGAGGKTKLDVLDLSSDPKEAYIIMMNVFKEKLGMFSSYDLHVRKEELENVQLQKRVNMDCEWKKLKPRSIKEHLIIDYVSRLKEEHNLSLKDSKKLFSKIQLGFNLKNLSSEDVNYSNCRINSIKGIEFIPESREWKLTNDTKNFNKTEKTSTTTNQKFNQAIDKFIREHKNRKLKL